MKLSKTGIFRKLSLEPQKEWVLRPDPGQARKRLARELSLSDSAARLLAARLPDPSVEAARAFLRPSLGDLNEPWKLSQMHEAVERILDAIGKNETICIYGDYDSDGVTACALLLRVLRALGHPEPRWYLPNRVEEGYGLSEAFIRQARDEEINLVITVDCGVSNHAEIRALQDAGIDVIVTDHHEPSTDLPPALAVIDPKLPGSDYPFRDLAGVGVAFKLAWALCERHSGSPKVAPELREVLLDVLAYVALGTIADVAPLLGENRVFATFGLRRLARTDHAGLKALLEVSQLINEKLEPRHVSFMIGPRLNAAGRMHDAGLALEVLTAEEPAFARQRANMLDRENVERQKLCQSIYEEARALVRETVSLEEEIPIVVVGEEWQKGVIGVVASKLVDEFRRPSVVIAMDPDGIHGTGSARSIPGFHLYEAMCRSRERFLSFGGHEMAAGFQLVRDQIDPFRQEFRGECRKQVRAGGLSPELTIDLDISLRQITDTFAREIEIFAPFGEGNPSPLFLSRHIKVAGRPQPLGSQGKHFSFFASQDNVAFRAVVFNNTEWMERMEKGTGYWDMVYSVRRNDFYDPPRLELHVKDMRPS
jgi:single-stranded-DNA-specific exonuclease